MTQGVDFAYGRPDPAAIRGNGFAFVCRYVSTAGNSKNLTRAELDGYHAAGLGVVVVFERDAGRPRLGRSYGVMDGRIAQQQADALGLPADRPIYAAVDFDPNPAELATVLDYLSGFAESAAPHPLGVYGGWRVVDAAQRAGIPFRWQAGAWDAGKGTHAGAHLRQRAKTVTVDGVSCDLNDALAPDFGAWRRTDNATGGDVTPEELEAAVGRAIDKKLAESPVAAGQRTWGGTIKATLAAVQTLANELRGLRGVADAIKQGVDALRAGGTTANGATASNVAQAVADEFADRLRG